MGETQQSATPPAASGGLTLDQVNQAITSALSAALNPLGEALKGMQANQAALAEKLTGTAAAEATAAAKGKETTPPALTAADVAKLVGDGIKAFAAGQSKATARQSYGADKLKDLPQTYRDLLPETDDPAALATAEQAIRSRYKAEVGDKIAAPAGVASQAGGAAAEGKVDLSKFTATQLLEHGIKTGAATTAPSLSAGAQGAAAK